MKHSPYRSLIARALLAAAALLCAATAQAQNTWVRFQTTQGFLDLKLLDTEAPITVNNFLAYVRGGDYADLFVHRDAWISATQPFVIQTGGYRWPATGGIAAVSSRGAIQNEFSPTRSNTRGTVAMAKLGTDPNSATSQWFVNMGNNAANLDNQNGGFTVFARVTANTMATADRIANLPTVNAGSPFNELPVQNWVSGQTTIQRTNVVLVTGVYELPKATDNDRIFNFLEASYPQYAQPAVGSGGNALGYNYRYYSGTNAYVGIKDGTLWYYMPSVDPGIYPLGTAAEWLNAAVQAGY